MRKVLFFDVKTHLLPEEMGSRIEELGVSIASCIVADINTSGIISAHFDTLREHELRLFFSYLQQCDALCGWGSTLFDAKVLARYLPPGAVEQRPHIDLKKCVETSSSTQISISDMCDSLGLARLGDNKDVIGMLRKGHWAEALRCSMMDVNVCLKLYMRCMLAKQGDSLLTKNKNGEQIKIDLRSCWSTIESEFNANAAMRLFPVAGQLDS